MSFKQAWKDATQFAKDAAQFAQVVTSGQASDEEYAARWKSCESCPRKIEVGGIPYCGACG